jgi:hypothetical protein
VKIRFLSFASTLLLSLLVVGSPALVGASSTNENNQSNGWAYFTADTSVPGQATLTFVSTRAFSSCFEYRTDGDTSQVLAENGGVNYGPGVTDGLYPYECVNNSTVQVTVSANDYVEVRTVFRAEGDERFDWTRVDVIPLQNDPAAKGDCKDDGWAAFGFSNQGQCVKFVNTSQASRP